MLRVNQFSCFGGAVTDTTAPTITSSNTASVAENTTAVLTATANETVTWSITGGADSAKFTINSSTGALAFATAPDYETPTDANTDNDYIVQITATDAATNATDQTITVTVTDVSGLWTPASITSTKIGWYDFSDGTTLTLVSSTHVSQINDKWATAGRNLTQSTDAQRPILATANLNSLNTAAFSVAGSQNIGNTAMGVASAGINHTFIAVMKVQSFAARKTPYFTYSGSINQGFLTIETTPGLGAYVGSDAGIANFGTSDITNFHLISATFTTTRREIFQDGLAKANNTTTAGTNGTLQWFRLGTDTSRFGGVEYAEVVAFVGTDATDRQKVEGYLAWKWGLTLDVGHPYFSAAPLI